MSTEEKRKNVFNVTLEFKEAMAINKVFGKQKDLSCIYTVEIIPRTARSSITKAFNIGNRGIPMINGKFINKSKLFHIYKKKFGNDEYSNYVIKT